MSAIDSLGASTATSSTDAYSALTSGEFLEIMFAELTNQDPLAPNDTQALLDQLSTIRAIESDEALTDQLGQLVSQNELTSASSLVGKFVTGRDITGTDVAGYVDSISVTSDGLIMNLSGGFRVEMDDLLEIIDPALLQADPANAAPTAGEIPAQIAAVDKEFLYTIPGATFNDDASLDGLTFEATLADGSALPPWLTFDPVTRTFAGTPGAPDVGAMSIRVTAIDGSGQQASTTFSVNILGPEG
ncbi:MAG: putative Ig domain-containing protein [Planctomycetota bacterium]